MSTLVNGFTCGVILFGSLAALAQENQGWSNPISADHPGFSDSSATVQPGVLQAEIGFESSFGETMSGGLNLLTRAGLVDGLEMRAEIPTWTLPLEEGQEMAVPLVEVGLKWQWLRTKQWSVAVLPTVLIPTGSKSSVYGDVSGSLSLIADVSLSSAWTLTTSVTPRWLRVEADESFENQFDVSFAAGLGWSLTQSLGLYLEGWGVVAEGNDGYEITPAGDLVLTVTLTPDMMLDLYGGVQWVSDELTPYGGGGFSVRF